MNKRLGIMAGLLLAAGCGKDEGPQLRYTLEVTPKHHGRTIDSCTIYLKYNALNAPADGRYDDSMRCVPVGGAPLARFRNVPAGNHYIYGYGWDPMLTPPKAVKGGYAYPSTGDTLQRVELAVSEDH